MRKRNTDFVPVAKNPADSVAWGLPSTTAMNRAPISCDTCRGPSPVKTQVSAVRHGLVALIASQYARLLSRLMASRKTTPGSAWSYVERMTCSHNARAGSLR